MPVQQQVFGIEKNGNGWFFHAYIDGVKTEYGPYATEAVARAAQRAMQEQLDASRKHDR